MLTYLSLREGSDFKQAEFLKPFRCLILSSGKVTAAWRSSVAEALVSSGCLYAMTWGVDCEEWHDTIDDECHRAFGLEDVPDDKFVMTTWHDRDTLEDVVHFAKFLADHPTVELEETVVLDIENSGRREMLLKLFANA